MGKKALYRNKVLDNLRNELDPKNEVILELFFNKTWFWKKIMLVINEGTLTLMSGMILEHHLPEALLAIITK